MKINNFGPSGVNPYKNQLNKLDAVEKATSQKKDTVEISPEAKAMQQISSFESERQMKIDELKNQVQNGTYKLQPAEIAKSMIQFYKK